MPGGQPLRLGPFIGGLNTASDPTAIADAELATCENFELDIDGSLFSRPPIRELAGQSAWTERIICLCEGIFSGTYYVIGSNVNGVYQYTGGTWTLITSTFQASAAVQYADKIYLVPKPGSANPGGKWDPVGGFTAVAAIPQGQAAVIHKERLFIAPGSAATTNPSRLKFSDAGNFDSWPASNFADISQGDGTKLIDLTTYQDNLMLFKNQSSFVFSYDVRPADAVVREISSTIGVEKQFCVANYENQIYILHRGWVYEIINYDFHRINTKVPFVRDTTAPSTFADEDQFLGIVQDRLVCRFLKKVYVYGLRTQTWSELVSTKDVLQFFGPIVCIHPPAGNEYYAGSSILAFRGTIQLYDKATSTSKETVLDPDRTTYDSFTRTVSDGWGTATEIGLVWTNSGGANSDYSVTGTVGQMSMGSVNTARTTRLPINKAAVDITIDLKTSVAAAGAAQTIDARARWQDANNYYYARLVLKHTGTFGLELVKRVAGVETSLVAGVDLGAYAATDTIRMRLQLNGTTIRAKLWKTTAQEPNGWTLSATDNSITAAGSLELKGNLEAGNTNVLPVLLTYDNLTYGDPTVVDFTITCKAQTKNFDMAISHQFKRLWWWGVDASSNNTIVGKATPITVSFAVTWGQLASKTWGELATMTWGQPLSGPSVVETSSPTGTGVNRRFAKFLKSMRYRQINFEVDLTTDGTTLQGPARLFTMTIITESKQVVSKAVS